MNIFKKPTGNEAYIITVIAKKTDRDYVYITLHCNSMICDSNTLMLSI